ncbi:hypothetical protein ABN763_02725 [Spongiivirga sp. MCCC 1A20706]|uniref:hypothetical protein n=1 Tax=Spongiivirga sp. MCCC 1A20706 TaxID=3160963 RepID=UPI00397794D6
MSIEELYLGQSPPDETPVVFAPQVVTTAGWKYGGVFTPDLKEFYFIREVGDSTENKKGICCFSI